MSAATPPAATAAPAPTAAVKPIRINELTICDFRGFPGPTPFKLDLKGKNLLVYGENGAGKSSIYHALNELFSLENNTTAGKRERLADLKNRFSKEPLANCFVEVKFDDGSDAKWTEVRHPAVSDKSKGDKNVVQGALRKAMLDYRSLLDTNYKHGNGQVNLFEVFIKTLLRDYPATKAGSSTQTVYEIWQEIEAIMEMGRISKGKRTDLTACIDAINTAVLSAIKEFLPEPPVGGMGPTDISPVNRMLNALGWQDVKLTLLEFNKFRLNGAASKAQRGFIGDSIIPHIECFNEEFEKPQNYLNEARLSALGLAIYLAARKVNTKFMPPDAPRLLVLDDVLIGLDHTNRHPVLKLISSQFGKDWQVILLTHDRIWFEMARDFVSVGDGWQAVELYERIAPNGIPYPFSIPTGSNPIQDNLDKADQYHTEHKYPAAAMHARMALEQCLKKACDGKVPVVYKKNERHVSSEDFLNAFKGWLVGKPQKAAVDPKINAIEMAKRVTLNPYSHSTPVTLSAAEVKSAIDAVWNFNSELANQKLYK
jgi:energy-coupling factor transporter ATP-binding protein EcfA2